MIFIGCFGVTSPEILELGEDTRGLIYVAISADSVGEFVRRSTYVLDGFDLSMVFAEELMALSVARQTGIVTEDRYKEILGANLEQGSADSSTSYWYSDVETFTEENS